MLKECNAGCKMAINSMEQLESKLEDGQLKSIVDEYKDKYVQIKSRTRHMLKQAGEEEKEPKKMASAMSWITTEMMMTFNGDNHQAAKLMMDGCNMGIQSVCEYENKYESASKEAKDTAHELVKIEKDFMEKIERFL